MNYTIPTLNLKSYDVIDVVNLLIDAECSAVEIGVYMLILRAYETGTPLFDSRKLSFNQTERAAVKSLLEKRLILEDGNDNE